MCADKKNFYVDATALYKNIMATKMISMDCPVCKRQFLVVPALAKYRKTCSYSCRTVILRAAAEEARKQYPLSDQSGRRSRKAIVWRWAVFRRDNYTCVTCGANDVPLESDHVLEWALHPEARFDIANGRTLCGPCHARTKRGAQTRNDMIKRQQELGSLSASSPIENPS